jgi:hypothetical protein
MPSLTGEIWLTGPTRPNVARTPLMASSTGMPAATRVPKAMSCSASVSGSDVVVALLMSSWKILLKAFSVVAPPNVRAARGAGAGGKNRPALARLDVSALPRVGPSLLRAALPRAGGAVGAGGRAAARLSARPRRPEPSGRVAERCYELSPTGRRASSGSLCPRGGPRGRAERRRCDERSPHPHTVPGSWAGAPP